MFISLHKEYVDLIDSVRNYGEEHYNAWKLKAEIIRNFHLSEKEYKSLSRNARNAYEHEFCEEVFERRIRKVFAFE